MPTFYIYNDLKIKYIISVILSTIIFLPLAMLSGFEGITIIINWAIIILAIAFIFDLIKTKRIDKIMIELDNCRVKEYVETYEMLISNYRKKSDFLLSNLAVGYIKLGEFEKARSYLNAISMSNKKKLSAINIEYVYLNNLCAVNILLGDVQSAEEYLKQMQDMINNPLVKHHIKTSFSYYYILNKMELDILKGDEDLKEKLCTLRLQVDNRLLTKVEANYGLGEFYEAQGEIEKARFHYNFAKENGGSSFYQKKAQSKLEELI